MLWRIVWSRIRARGRVVVLVVVLNREWWHVLGVVEYVQFGRQSNN
jgi:hypothetical protein